MTTKLERLNDVFNRAFDVKVNINNHTDKKNLDSWDSFNHLNLIVEIESEYSIKFSIDEINNISSVKDIFNLLDEKN